MHYFFSHKLISLASILLMAICLLIVVEVLIIKCNGSPVPVPSIPRTARTIGQGPPLVYAVLGDSTAIGQGGAYERGIALATTRFLAEQGYTITMQNFAVSGARSRDVRTKQADQAKAIRPDVILVSVGANDVTHLTKVASIQKDLRASIDMFRRVSPSVRIVLTGAPQMGSVPRFPQPVRHYAQVRTAQVNTAIRHVAQEKDVTFAALADKTGPVFMRHPELFAPDKFHPNNAGYEVWKPILNEALKASLR